MAPRAAGKPPERCMTPGCGRDIATSDPLCGPCCRSEGFAEGVTWLHGQIRSSVEAATRMMVPRLTTDRRRSDDTAPNPNDTRLSVGASCDGPSPVDATPKLRRKERPPTSGGDDPEPG